MLWHWFGAMVWRNVQRTMLIDIARMWPGVYALTGLTLACSQREKVGGYAACQCLHWPPFMSCTVVLEQWPFRWGLVTGVKVPCFVVLLLVHAHCSFAAVSSSARDKRYRNTYIHTYIRTYIHAYIHTYIHTYTHTILPSRSFTTSVVFPSFPVPAKTIETHFRKKLTCGVIRSFNSSHTTCNYVVIIWSSSFYVVDSCNTTRIYVAIFLVKPQPRSRGSNYVADFSPTTCNYVVIFSIKFQPRCPSSSKCIVGSSHTTCNYVVIIWSSSFYVVDSCNTTRIYVAIFLVKPQPRSRGSNYVADFSPTTCNYVVIFPIKFQLRCWLLQLRCYLLDQVPTTLLVLLTPLATTLWPSRSRSNHVVHQVPSASLVLLTPLAITLLSFDQVPSMLLTLVTQLASMLLFSWSSPNHVAGVPATLLVFLPPLAAALWSSRLGSGYVVLACVTTCATSLLLLSLSSSYYVGGLVTQLPLHCFLLHQVPTKFTSISRQGKIRLSHWFYWCVYWCHMVCIKELHSQKFVLRKPRFAVVHKFFGNGGTYTAVPTCKRRQLKPWNASSGEIYIYIYFFFFFSTPRKPSDENDLLLG